MRDVCVCTKQNRELSFLAFIEPLSVSGLFSFFFFLIGKNYMCIGERLKVGRIISENIWVPLQISR